jgi:hypothetical protein
MDAGVCSVAPSLISASEVSTTICLDHDVHHALEMGSQLIQNGGDHFDIHYDTTNLTALDTERCQQTKGSSETRITSTSHSSQLPSVLPYP